mgnify:CR=1 FL=1
MSSPAKGTSAPTSAGIGGAEPSATEAKPRVLIVDDEIYNLETFLRVFAPPPGMRGTRKRG